MDQNKRKTQNVKKSFFFPVLVLIFAMVSLFGLITSLSVNAGPEKALKKTGNALVKNERETLALLSLLEEGALSLNGGGISLHWNGDLSDAYSLSMKKEKEDLSLFGREETLTLYSNTLFSAPLTANRTKAAEKLTNSIFTKDNTEAEDLFALRAFLALTDPALESDDGMDALLSAARRAKPVREKEEGAFAEGGKEGVFYRYTFRSEHLVRFCQGLVKEFRDEESRENASAILLLSYALAGKEAPVDLSQKTSEFLSGKGELYDAFSVRAGKADSFATVEIFLLDGYAAGFNLRFELGEYKGSASLFLGENPKKSNEISLSLQLLEKDKEILSLTANLAVTDDSKMAFIREFTFRLKDETGFFLTDQTEKDGTLRFSWGREKGDLGLKWVSGEEEYTLRGSLDSYKRGKKLDVTVKRVEKGKENLLKNGDLILSLSRKSETALAPEGGTELFCDGDAKLSLKEAYELAKNELLEEITE